MVPLKLFTVPKSVVEDRGVSNVESHKCAHRMVTGSSITADDSSF